MNYKKITDKFTSFEEFRNRLDDFIESGETSTVIIVPTKLSVDQLESLKRYGQERVNELSEGMILSLGYNPESNDYYAELN